MAHKIPQHTKGSMALMAWLETNSATKNYTTHLAAHLGITASAVWYWAHGRALPRIQTAAHLERLTGGSVPLASWAEPFEASAQ